MEKTLYVDGTPMEFKDAFGNGQTQSMVDNALRPGVVPPGGIPGNMVQGAIGI